MLDGEVVRVAGNKGERQPDAARTAFQACASSFQDRFLGWEPMLNMLAEDDEADDIRAILADRAELDTFFRCWTAKEMPGSR